MPPNDDRSQPKEPAAQAPVAKRRLRIEKLEERIAPKKGGKGTNNCPNTSDFGVGSTGTSGFTVDGGGTFTYRTSRISSMSFAPLKSRLNVSASQCTDPSDQM